VHHVDRIEAGGAPVAKLDRLEVVCDDCHQDDNPFRSRSVT